MQQNTLNYCPRCGYKLTIEEIKPEEISILEGYESVDESGIKIAIPGVLDNRKRLMELRNRPIPIIRPVRNDGEMDKFGSLVVGEGLIQEG